MSWLSSGDGRADAPASPATSASATASRKTNGGTRAPTPADGQAITLARTSALTDTYALTGTGSGTTAHP
jgi:hypothetical protein